MPLTDTAIRNAKPKAKPYKLADGAGLHLLMNPNGSRWWRLRYRFGGVEKMLSLGVYPEIGLKEARERRESTRKQIAIGIDPSIQRKVQKATGAERAANSFEVVSREWFTKYEPTWAAGHSNKIIARLEKDLFPWIGQKAVSEITAPELLAVLRRIENRGAIETAHRAMQNCGQIFRYAIATSRAERDVAADLRGALAPVQSKHYASITEPKQIGNLLRDIDNYQGAFVTRCALQLTPLVFVRPGELRHAKWIEIDLEVKEWRIPAEKMKAREIHIVPLARQALNILHELYPLTSASQYVFPSIRTHSRPMSENAVLAALRRLGYSKEEMTPHGFRSMASTLLNEQGWHRDAIERQLAHAERNSVRAAYNYAEYLPERRKMMQAWADYLDALKTSAKILSLKKST